MTALVMMAPATGGGPARRLFGCPETSDRSPAERLRRLPATQGQGHRPVPRGRAHRRHLARQLRGRLDRAGRASSALLTVRPAPSIPRCGSTPLRFAGSTPPACSRAPTAPWSACWAAYHRRRCPRQPASRFHPLRRSSPLASATVVPSPQWTANATVVLFSWAAKAGHND